MAVKKARSRREMREPKPEKTAEKLPWAEKARETAEEGTGGETE